MDDKPSSTIPSNEEVIEDLTRDLASSCQTSDTNHTRSRNDTGDKNSKTSGDPWHDIGKESNCQDDDEPEAPIKEETPPDFVDEEALKDREVTLSDDDKQVFSSSHSQ